MSDGPKLLLIDANNMCHRVFWAQRGRQKKGPTLTCRGKGVDVLYGFFRQLIHLHKKFPDYFRVIAWDKGYARRLAESEEGVKKGLIPSAYKSTREHDTDDYEELHVQMDQLRHEALPLVRCVQSAVDGTEADDIINTYAKTYPPRGVECVVVSTDKDFFQVLADGVTIYDAMRKETWTRERFTLEFGFDPSLWVDAGAIMGEVGKSKDNIYGVDGWGPKTTFQYVREHGDAEAIKAAIEAVPEKKRKKREHKFLEQAERLELARSLKRMDVLPKVPKPRVCVPLSEEILKKFFIDWKFVSLMKDAWRLV